VFLRVVSWLVDVHAASQSKRVGTIRNGRIGRTEAERERKLLIIGLKQVIAEYGCGLGLTGVTQGALRI